jgi:hypothetical protein
MKKNEGLWGINLLDSNRLVVSLFNEGLWVFDLTENKFVHQTRKSPSGSSLFTNCIEGVFVFKGGYVWVTDWGSGVCYQNIHKQKMKAVWAKDLPESPADQEFTNICSDHNNNLLIGTNNGIYVHNEKGMFQKRLGQKNGLPSEQIKGICRDSESQIWVMTTAGLGYFDSNLRNFTPVSLDTIFSYNNSSIYCRELGRNTIGFGGYGLFTVQKDQTGRWREAEIERRKTWSRDNIPWFAPIDGQRIILNKDLSTTVILENDKTTHIPITNPVGACSVDGKTDGWWVATTYGLKQLDLKNNTVIQSIDESNGLQNQCLSTIIKDKNGLLWLPHLKGISTYNPSTQKHRFFTSANGLEEEENVSDIAYEHPNGTIWTGNQKVIHTFDPSQLEPLNYFAKPAVTLLKINNQELKPAQNPDEVDSLSLSYDQNTLDVHAVVLEFADPKNTVIRYRLIGFDDTWQEQKGGTVTLRYIKLPPGKYTLEFGATNSDGIENPELKSVFMHIHPPFWETWWFRILVATLITGGAIFYYKRSIAQLRHENELIQQKNQAELSALRAFINPHFLFNALNSLNSFILNKNLDNANTYLGNFSKLMRQMLDLAQKQVVTIQEDIDLNKLYIDLERQRFQKPFDFVFEIDPAIDTFNTFIPSMLLQPYIENCIWHGLQHKEEGKGILTIKIERDAKQIICTIEDNGVGRAAAAKIREVKGKRTHKSQGLDITKSRLTKLEGLNSVETIDLFDENQVPRGTRVVVRIDLDLEPA